MNYILNIERTEPRVMPNGTCFFGLIRKPACEALDNDSKYSAQLNEALQKSLSEFMKCMEQWIYNNLAIERSKVHKHTDERVGKWLSRHRVQNSFLNELLDAMGTKVFLTAEIASRLQKTQSAVLAMYDWVEAEPNLITKHPESQEHLVQQKILSIIDACNASMEGLVACPTSFQFAGTLSEPFRGGSDPDNELSTLERNMLYVDWLQHDIGRMEKLISSIAALYIGRAGNEKYVKILQKPSPIRMEGNDQHAYLYLHKKHRDTLLHMLRKTGKPLVDEQGQEVIDANGRIWDYEEFIAQLQALEEVAAIRVGLKKRRPEMHYRKRTERPDAFAPYVDKEIFMGKMTESIMQRLEVAARQKREETAENQEKKEDNPPDTPDAEKNDLIEKIANAAEISRAEYTVPEKKIPHLSRRKEISRQDLLRIGMTFVYMQDAKIGMIKSILLTVKTERDTHEEHMFYEEKGKYLEGAADEIHRIDMAMEYISTLSMQGFPGIDRIIDHINESLNHELHVARNYANTNERSILAIQKVLDESLRTLTTLTDEMQRNSADNKS